jgi:hypothetical protein
MKIIKKIAFLIHNEMILDHFYSVFKYLNNKHYDLIFLNNIKKEKIKKKFIKNKNFIFLKTWSPFWKKNKYKISVSNLFIDGSRLKENYFYVFIKRIIIFLRKNDLLNKILSSSKIINFIYNQEIYFPLKAGKINIRFLYGIWFDNFQLGKFNLLYDYILSHGPYDRNIFKLKYPKLKIFKMGYPKYEENININERKEIFSKYLRNKKNIKNILFVPTTSRLDGLSSLIFFYKNLKKFNLKNYKLIIKLHPQDDLYATKFEGKKNIILIKDHTINLLTLISMSDYIICDYGGMPFGASFLGKKIIRIKTKEAILYNSNINSPKDILDKILPAKIIEGEYFDFNEIINNKELWQDQRWQRKKLCDLFFYNKNKNSGLITANFLKRELFKI